MREFEAIRCLVKSILQRPEGLQWTVQGFGMMRTYFGLDKRFRLNIWDKSLSIPNVSVIHDHPWNLYSWVLSGQLLNQRYAVGYGEEYQSILIQPGEGGGPRGRRELIRLQPLDVEDYRTGGVYSQRAYEIHATSFMDGTVTLNDRTDRAEQDRARVCWLAGDWVDAEPRLATSKEINYIILNALRNWL